MKIAFIQNEVNLTITSWEDDTTLEPDAYVFTSSSGGSNNILSYTSSTGVFVRSTTDPIINMYRMWVLEDINYRVGDVTLDVKINIQDTTSMQKYLAGLETFNNMQYYLADYDFSGTVTVKDVSAMQKYLANITT